MSNSRPAILGPVTSALEYRAGTYPELGQNETAKKAIRVCQACPVRQACLDYALSQPPSNDHGVWGGTTHLQRRRLRKQRNENAA